MNTLKLITKPAPGRFLAIGGMLAAALIATGCAIPISSNPTLAITEATVYDEHIDLQVMVENPSQRDLTVTGINYQAIYGPLPVGEGRWEGSEPLPKGTSVPLDLRIYFQEQPLDPTATTVEVNGTIETSDGSAKGKMGMQSGTFSASHEVTPVK